MRIAKRFALLLAAMFSLLTASLARAETGDAMLARAQKAYLSGDMIEAVALLQSLADGKAAADQRLNAGLRLAALCDEIRDFDCFSQNNVQMLKLLPELDAGARRHAQAQIGPWLVRYAVWAPKSNLFDPAKEIATLNALPVNEIDPEPYLALQSSAFTYAIDKKDRVAARRALSRLIARILLLHGESKAIMARYIAEVTKGLRTIRDDPNAMYYFLTFDAVIQKFLPEKTPEHVSYLILSASFWAETHLPEFLAKSFDQTAKARTLALQLKIPTALREDFLSRIAIQNTLSNLIKWEPVGGEAALEAAFAAHRSNALYARKAQLQAQENFSSIQEFYFCVLDILLAQRKGVAPDRGWMRILTASRIDDFGARNFEPLEAYRYYAIALLSGLDTEEGGVAIQRAARENIASIEENIFARTRSLPFFNNFDDEIMNLALVKLSSVPAAKLPDDIVLKSVGLFQRDFRSRRGDDLYRLAAANTQTQRNLERAVLGLADIQRDIEMLAIKRLLTGEADARWLQNASSFSQSLTQQQDAAIAAMAPDSEATRHLATLKEAQPLLGKDEALIAEANFRNVLFKVCIRKDRWHFSTALIPLKSITNDLKILRASLTATHSPSESLDMQYPVQAAVDMKKLVFDGLEDCLQGAHKLSFSSPSFMSDITLAALLNAKPERFGEGYDLSKADWVLNSYDLTYVTSIEEFVATRRLKSVSRKADLPFIGIGDPILKGGPFAALPELPETGTELKSIGALFPGARLLVRDAATEKALAKAELHRFNVIEFATHGVAGGESDATSEPGLVLSPGSGARDDNALLSATEIVTYALSAQLVVLSACNTASFGFDSNLGGIRALTASFALAGVPSAVASLWPVESLTSQRIITDFFEGSTRKKESVSQALAQSMRHFVTSPPSKAFAHPRFWAPFILYGDGSAKLDGIH